MLPVVSCLGYVRFWQTLVDLENMIIDIFITHNVYSFCEHFSHGTYDSNGSKLECNSNLFSSINCDNLSIVVGTRRIWELESALGCATFTS